MIGTILTIVPEDTVQHSRCMDMHHHGTLLTIRFVHIHFQQSTGAVAPPVTCEAQLLIKQTWLF